MLRIMNLHLGIEEFTYILFIIISGNPTLTELQTDIIKGNLFGNDSCQSGLGIFQSRNDACINIIPRLLALNHVKGCIDISQLLIDITGKGLAGNLITAIRHIIDLTLQQFRHLFLLMSC